MAKRFLASVADVVAIQNNNVVFTAQTLTKSAIDQSTNATEIRGGFSNALQAIYYHDAAVKITLTDVQFRPEFFAYNSGSVIESGGDIWYSESVTLSGTTGSLTKTPVAIDGEDLVVWSEYNSVWYTLPATSGTPYTFSTSATAIPSGATICVKYMYNYSSSTTVTIPANFTPSRLRLYMTAKLIGDTSGTGEVGTATFEIPSLQLSGSQTLDMAADSNSTCSLDGMALAYEPTDTVGCASNSYYFKVTQTLNTGNWYDNATALAIVGGNFTMDVSSTQQLDVRYVVGENSYTAPLADLTFSCTPTTSADVGAHTGLVTSTASAGTGLITVIITAKPTIEAECTVTVE